MLFADRLTLDAPRRTCDGYLVTRARAARSGVYQYLGREVDPEGKRFKPADVVNVYRPAEEVFATDSVASFLMKPITNDHPRDAVTADNWRQHAKGVVGKALRDGEHLAFDLVLMDAETIADVESGKRELSNGYGCDLSFEDGTAPDGTAYQAVQRRIRGNHVAIVGRGRAGSSCRIGDAATCETVPSVEIDRILADQRTYDRENRSGNNPPERRETSKPGEGGAPLQDGAQSMPKFMLVDGLQVEVTDQAEAAITKLQGQLKDERDARATDKATHDKAMATKDAEIDELKAKVVDQAQIDRLADAKAAIVADAKAIVGDKLGDTSGKTVADVRRMACAAAGIDVKDKSDDYIEARFDTLRDAKPGADPLRAALADGVRVPVTDNRAAVNTIRTARYN